MNTRLILVRHAITDANISDKFLGMTDMSLSELGFHQASKLGQRIAEEFALDVLYTSTLQRTKQTAEAIQKYQKVHSYMSSKLVEMNFGEWEGRTFEEIATEYPQEFVLWSTKQCMSEHIHAETMKQVQNRIVDEVNSILERHLGKTICIVTHGVCIKALMAYFEGVDLDHISTIPWCDNTGITVVDVCDNHYSIQLRFDTMHLLGDLAPKTYDNVSQLIELALQRISSKLYINYV